MPFAVSIALPPPTATTKSQALDLKASIPFCTELTSGQGSNEVNATLLIFISSSALR